MRYGFYLPTRGQTATPEALETLLDDEGSVLIRGERGIGLLDDRDLERYAEIGDALPRIDRADVALRFGYVQNPADSLR